MSEVFKFDYQGQRISFEFSDGNKMINATEMAKPFGKRINDFLRQKSTQEYILILEERYTDEPGREVLRVVKGGDAELQGTWMDEKLALKFAAWLAPIFELWVYDKIHELLTSGKATVREYRPNSILKSLRLIVAQLEEQDEINAELRQDVDFIAERIDELEAKITSVDDKYYTIAGYCALKKIPCPLDMAREWGKLATRLSREKKVPTGTAHDERFGRVRTYHESILHRIIEGT